MTGRECAGKDEAELVEPRPGVTTLALVEKKESGVKPAALQRGLAILARSRGNAQTKINRPM
jgi:hypothetical protein